MKEFYSTSVAKVYYDEVKDVLFLEYVSKVLNDAQFVEINSAVLEAFKHLSTQRFVADIRKMGIIGVASQQWVLTNLLPGMIAHLKGKTLFHAQLLDPKEVLSKVSGSNIKNKSQQVLEGIEVVQCTDVESLNAQLKSWK
jgi:hypothetical protein